MRASVPVLGFTLLCLHAACASGAGASDESGFQPADGAGGDAGAAGAGAASGKGGSGEAGSGGSETGGSGTGGSGTSGTGGSETGGSGGSGNGGNGTAGSGNGGAGGSGTAGSAGAGNGTSAGSGGSTGGSGGAAGSGNGTSGGSAGAGKGGSAGSGTGGSAGSGTGGSAGGSGGASTCAKDTNEPNDSEAAAKGLPDATDCDDTGGTIDGILDGQQDQDWFTVHFTDKSLCQVDRSLTVNTTIGMKICMYFKADSGTKVPDCSGGSAAATSPAGYAGCCTQGKALQLSYGSTGGSDDSTVHIQLSGLDVNAKCGPYSAAYHF